MCNAHIRNICESKIDWGVGKEDVVEEEKNPEMCWQINTHKNQQNKWRPMRNVCRKTKRKRSNLYSIQFHIVFQKSMCALAIKANQFEDYYSVNVISWIKRKKRPKILWATTFGVCILIANNIDREIEPCVSPVEGTNQFHEIYTKLIETSRPVYFKRLCSKLDQLFLAIQTANNFLQFSIFSFFVCGTFFQRQMHTTQRP